MISFRLWVQLSGFLVEITAQPSGRAVFIWGAGIYLGAVLSLGAALVRLGSRVYLGAVLSLWVLLWFIWGAGFISVLCTWSGAVSVPPSFPPARTGRMQEQCVLGSPRMAGVVFLPELLHHTAHITSALITLV